MSGTNYFQRKTKTVIALLLSAQFGLAAVAGAAQNVTVNWEQPSSGDPIAAYRLYQNDQLLCETLDPAARQITCPTEVTGSSVFTLAAVYGDPIDVVTPPANTAPVSSDLSLTVNEDETASSFLQATDQENDSVSFSVISAPKVGYISGLNALTGAFQYTPNADFFGVDSFTYMANDGTDDSNPATVNITILPVNDMPTADAGADQSVDAGSVVTLDGRGSFDPDDGIASVNWVQTAGTQVVLSSADALNPSFTAPAGTTEAVSLSFTLTVTDMNGLQQADSCTVVVVPQAVELPTGTNTVTISWDAPAAGEIVSFYRIFHNGIALCETADGSALEISCPVTLANDENIITVTAIYDDSVTPTDPGTTDPTPTDPTPTDPTPTDPTPIDPTPSDPFVPANQVPFASAIETTVAEDGMVYDKLNGIDADGDSLTYNILTEPSFGLVELLNQNTGEFRYLPDRDATGTDTFLYEVSDGKDVSDSAEVTVAIVPVNDAPVANAGPDQVVNEGETVMLDSTNSFDVDDQYLTVSWEQLDGPAVVLSDSLSIQPQFQAVDIGMDSVTLVFQLTVTDAMGLQSTDVSNVNVVWVNEPPMAAAGEDQAVFEGDEVMLDASGSTDSDDGIASYAWAQISGPEMTLSDSSAMQPTFITPDVGPEGASVAFELTATDFGGLYTKDTVVINISWVNVAPVADAGPDQNVSAGEVVILDGSLSSDEDDGIATLRWVQKTGLPVTLDNPTAAQPQFTAPADILETAVLTFELIITDYSGLQNTDGCTVTVAASQQSASLPGDLDSDGDVDRTDLAILKTSLNTCVGETGYLEEADLDGDSCVTKADTKVWYTIYRSY